MLRACWRCSRVQRLSVSNRHIDSTRRYLSRPTLFGPTLVCSCRNAVPPPLNVVWVVASVVYWIMCCCCKRKPTTGKASGFSVFKDEETSANIRYTERELLKRVLKQDSARQSNTTDFKVLPQLLEVRCIRSPEERRMRLRTPHVQATTSY